MSLFGGAALTANVGYNQGNMIYNGYKIGKSYDKLKENPFEGSGQDVIAKMKNHNGENVLLQRGEAIRGENGEIIAAGNELKQATGTRRNYGLNKAIYKHDMNKAQVQQIPRYIKKQPVEVSPRGQDIYVTMTSEGEIKVVATPKNGTKIISSMHKIKR